MIVCPGLGGNAGFSRPLIKIKVCYFSYTSIYSVNVLSVGRATQQVNKIATPQGSKLTIFMDWVIFWIFLTDFRRMPISFKLGILVRFSEDHGYYNKK